MFDSGRFPVVLGTVALDFLHEGPLGAGIAPATVRWGGVSNNVACVLGVRGVAPLLVTADYTGELRSAVSEHLEGNGVAWSPLPVRAPLPVFHAELVDGSVVNKHFLGGEALELLEPSLLDRYRSLFEEASVLVAATDSSAVTLRWLADTAASAGIPFWLLSADPTEVAKLSPLTGRANLVALNLRELTLWAGRSLTGHAEVADAARRLVGTTATCVVTLGDEGALLVRGATTEPVYQRAHPVVAGVTVGAGDVLFAGLLEARLVGKDWPDALAEATGLATRYLAELHHSDLPYEGLRLPAAAR